MDDADRPGRPRLPVEDRRQRAAVRARRPDGLRLRRRQTKHRLDFWWHGRGETLSEVNFIAEPADAPGRVHPAGRVRPAPLRPLLQRQQVRRRDRHVRVPRAREEALPHRRRPARRPRLLDGRGGVLAVRASTTRRCGPRPPRGPGSPRRRSSSTSSRTRRSKPTWYEKKLWRLYNAPTTPRTSSTCRRSPTAARSTGRSRPPT